MFNNDDFKQIYDNLTAVNNSVTTTNTILNSAFLVPVNKALASYGFTETEKNSILTVPGLTKNNRKFNYYYANSVDIVTAYKAVLAKIVSEQIVATNVELNFLQMFQGGATTYYLYIVSKDV